jgi:hypothetical protein
MYCTQDLLTNGMTWNCATYGPGALFPLDKDMTRYDIILIPKDTQTLPRVSFVFIARYRPRWNGCVLVRREDPNLRSVPLLSVIY